MEQVDVGSPVSLTESRGAEQGGTCRVPLHPRGPQSPQEVEPALAHQVSCPGEDAEAPPFLLSMPLALF